MCFGRVVEATMELYSIGTFSARLFLSVSLIDGLPWYMSKTKSHLPKTLHSDDVEKNACAKSSNVLRLVVLTFRTFAITSITNADSVACL